MAATWLEFNSKALPHIGSEIYEHVCLAPPHLHSECACGLSTLSSCFASPFATRLDLFILNEVFILSIFQQKFCLSFQSFILMSTIQAPCNYWKTALNGTEWMCDVWIAGWEKKFAQCNILHLNNLEYFKSSTYYLHSVVSPTSGCLSSQPLIIKRRKMVEKKAASFEMPLTRALPFLKNCIYAFVNILWYSYT